MWETIESVANGNNADSILKSVVIIVLAVLLVISIIVTIGIVTGKIKIKTKSVSINEESEKERTILRNQITQLRVMADGAAAKLIPDEKRLDQYRTRFVVERVCNVLEEAALFNHIHRGDETYIKIKQGLVYNTVLKYTNKEYFRSKEFEDSCNQFTRDVLNEFVNIRETYS